MLTRLFAAGALLLALAASALAPAPALADTARVNGLDLYYEVHGEGPPLVLLHGAYMDITSNWAGMIPVLSDSYRVIAVELQAHGRTSDRDTPITYAGMADDVAGLLDRLDIPRAIVFGYSMGGGVALQFAVRHPDMLERLVVASAGISYDAYPAGFHDMIEAMTPDFFMQTPLWSAYEKFGHSKAEFATLVGKLRDLDLDRFAWNEEDFARVKVPTLLIFGDADVISMDHIAKLHHLMGGVHDADTNGLPLLQLAILPGTPHTGVFFNPHNVELLNTIVPTFLAQKLPQPPMLFE